MEPNFKMGVIMFIVTLKLLFIILYINNKEMVKHEHDFYGKKIMYPNTRKKRMLVKFSNYITHGIPTILSIILLLSMIGIIIFKIMYLINA